MGEGEATWRPATDKVAEFSTGANCVHFILPFQCETCWMRNLEGRSPLPGGEDRSYVEAIRRANLDAMAGQSRKTISKHAGEVRMTVKNCRTINKTPSLPPKGPFPVMDMQGMGLAVELLLRSIMTTGKYETHVQFDTARKLRSSYSRMWGASPEGVAEGATFSKGTGTVRLTSCPSQSDWYAQFIRGMEWRVGRISRPNLATSADVFKAIVAEIEREILEADKDSESDWIKLGALVVLLLVGSLRGYEGLFLDLGALRKHLAEGRDGVMPNNPLSSTDSVLRPYVVCPLLGNFKGELGFRCHMLPLASTTRSGFELRRWMERLVILREEEGCVTGPAFGDHLQKLPPLRDFDEMFIDVMKKVQQEQPDLLSPTENVDHKYGLSRTPRKTAQTRARNFDIPTADQNAMNRWAAIEKAKGARPRFSMQDVYSDPKQMVPVTWRYSYCQ